MDGLTADEMAELDVILTTARKWVRENPVGTPLHDHGMQTLAYWGPCDG